MGDKPISFRDKDGNFVSAADVWNPKKLEELFTRLNPNRKLRLERERLAKLTFALYPNAKCPVPKCMGTGHRAPKWISLTLLFLPLPA